MEIKNALYASVLAVCVITVLGNILGLFGVCKGHYCMTLTFAVLKALTTLLTIAAPAIELYSYWGTFLLNLGILILAYFYAYDLKQSQIGTENKA